MGPLWIVIPTRDRHEALAAQIALLGAEARKLARRRPPSPRLRRAGVLRSSAGAKEGRRVEVVVSDDGSAPPVRIDGGLTALPQRSQRTQRKGKPNDAGPSVTSVTSVAKGVSRRTRLVRSGTPRGPNAARDAAVRLSPADAVIVEIDDHDLIEPGALREIDRAFRAGAFLAFGDFRRVNSRGEVARVEPVVRKGRYAPWRFREEGALHVGLRAYRRTLYDEVGGYRHDEFPGGDYALMLRMEARLRGRGIVAIPKVLCSVVTSARGISVRCAKEQARAADEYRRRVAAEFAPDLDSDDSPEPEPPDFAGVRERYTWRGEAVSRDLLQARTGFRKREGPEVYCPDGPRPDVSAIVPLYRSARVVERCLRSLVASLPPGSEIIVVDDASPDRAGEVAARVLADFERGLVVRLSRNTGYAHANNVGAGLAGGRYLLLFNADAYAPREGFVRPMLRLLEENPDAAIVGNRHVTPGGRVDSEGSEFSWRAKTYQHVGRDIADPVAGDGVKARDMVTFACALVRRASWDELGGLDERYRRAYFEDSDFCMRVRSRGWRVLYTPESEIAHVGRHSQAGNGGHYRANAALFRRRWVHTGMVDRFRRERGIRAHEGRIVVCMIACSEAEFIASALESVYPLADRVVVVEGGNEHAVRAGLCDAKGRSLDGTREEITSFIDERDPERKVLAVTRDDRPWRDKNEMREAYAAELRPGDWMLLLDADEVFTVAGLWRMSSLCHEADVVCPGFHLFWNDLATLGTGRWDDFPQVKAVRWRKGLTYLRDHNMPCDSRGVAVTAIRGARVVRTRERLYCHYSWAGKSDGKLARKARYYVEQNGPRVFPPDWFERVFLAWRDAPLRVEREFGTHPYGGGGTEPFTGVHPEPVRRRMAPGGREGPEA